MGKLIAPLASRTLPQKAIFDKRFVLECCETFHIHWRNLRLEVTYKNFVDLVNTLQRAVEDWKKHGAPQHSLHLEIGRMEIRDAICNPTQLKVELCENLYKTHETSKDSHFLEDPSFVHLHYRDLRIEMSNADFLTFARAVMEASNKLSSLTLRTLAQLFQQLNEHNILYVVIRNWEGLPERVELGPHSDLDLLVHPQHVAQLIELWGGERTHQEPFRVQYRVPVLGADGQESFILVDVRTPGDGYFPEGFAHRLLSHRIMYDHFYALPPADYFLSLLYHVVFHKGVMTEDYKEKLMQLSGQASISFDRSRACNFQYACQILQQYEIHDSVPSDHSVLPFMPYIYSPKQVLYSRLLTVHEGVPYHSRIYFVEENGERRIRKQSSGDLAEREYNFLSKLQSEHFPKAFACWNESNSSICEMEYIDGSPLSRVEEFCIGKDTALVKRFIHECLDILDELQAHGILHRDIRAENILVRDGHPVLIDFGWAVSDDMPHITPSGLGNEGRPPDGSFCDVYSMGVALKSVCMYYPELMYVVEAMSHPDPGTRVTDLSRLKKMLEEEKPTLEQFKQASIELAERYTQEQYYEAAERVLLKVLNQKPDQPDVLTRLGELALAQDCSAEAEVYFAKALALDETQDGARFQYGVLLHNRGQLQQAVEQFEVLLLHSPTSTLAARAHNELGVFYFQQGEQAKALEHFERAVELDRHYVTAQKNLADVYLQLGQTEQAVQVNKKILDDNPNDIEALLWLGNVCFELGRDQDAEFFYRRTLELDPENAIARDNLGILELHKHNLFDGSRGGNGEASSPSELKDPPQDWPARIEVSIVIPVFNQVGYTRRCLQALYQHTSKEVSFEVIVVDNASTDGTKEFMGEATQRYAHVQYIRNPRNLFFAKACNIGAQAARGKYLVFLNNDTEPQPGWLEEMLAILERYHDVGIVGSKLLYPDGTIQHAGVDFALRGTAAGNLPWPYHRFRGFNGHDKRASESAELLAVTGACLMIQKDLFITVGGFDEGYRMYFEDLDLCLRVVEMGKKVVYTPRSVVVHHEGKSSNDRDTVDRLNHQSAPRFFSRWQKFLETHIATKQKIHHEILWAAPFFNPSGYASEAINFVLPLESQVPLRISHFNNIYSREFVVGLPGAVREALDRLNQKFGRTKGYVLVIHNPASGFFRPPEAAYCIGRTMFETDRLPADWVERCNAMDEVWVPTSFNMRTFAQYGVKREKLFKVPEAIDIHHFDPEITEPLELPGKRAFNFLAVFEWSERKACDILLKAYFEEFTAADDVCLYLKTYLMSRAESDDTAEILQRIRAYADSWGLTWDELPAIQIIGYQISTMQLPRLYKAVDAFVAPSRGEGWGRPHMEAMAMELPVIATNWSGNTEFMNEQNSYLIDIEGLTNVEKMEIPIYVGHRWAQPSVKHLRKLLRHVVTHPQEAKTKGKKARKDIVAKYSQEKVAEIVLDRLRKIEEKLSPSKANAKAAVVWEGQQFAHHSLALINRELCKRLVTTGYDLSVWPVGSEQFVPKNNSPLACLTQCVRKPLTTVDVHVRHHWPPNLNPPVRGHWVIFQPWEFGSLPKEWVHVFATQADELWVPSNYVKQVYVESGVPESRVFVIPLGIDPQLFHPSVKPFKLKTRKRFKFLFVGGTIYRKGIDLLVDAYVRQFKRSDDVCLVIKDMGGESFYKGQTFKAKIREVQTDANAPDIEYIDDILSPEELAGLYRACDALVHPYRGEGFGLPILEAMACGLPPIVTNGGACLDFCNSQNSLLVKAQKKRFAEKSIDGMETVDYPWMFEVELDDLENKMRYAFEHPEQLQAIGAAASKQAHSGWTWQKSFNKLQERILALKNAPIRRHSYELLNIRNTPDLLGVVAD